MRLYEFIMAAIKLFFLNVFVYTIFFETYVFGALLQKNFHLELPFFLFFISGFFSFILITIWFNVATIWHRRIKSNERLMSLALVSELPFIILILILWMILYVRGAPPGLLPDLYSLLILFGSYMILFPIITALSPVHHKKVSKIKRMP